MNTRTAWLFPGQGAQEVGMGRALFSLDPRASEIFERAEEMSGLPLKTVCQRGPDATLVLTNYLQPTLVALSVAFVDYLKRNGRQPAVVAGHSLGEISALYAAEVLELDDTLRLAVARGRLMAESAVGGMMAIKDLPTESIQSFVGNCKDGVVVAANYNSPQQVVVSGDESGLEQVRRQATEVGGVCIRLNVQGAWHSPLVRTAAEAFRNEVAAVKFSAPKYPLCIGMTASLERDPDHIQSLIQNQICSPVHWTGVIKQLESMGITRYWEVGPGKVLKGLMRKIIDDVNSYEVVSVDNRKFLTELQGKKADGV